jgi:glycosyltransferase involved in cell wall biosynthesis
MPLNIMRKKNILHIIQSLDNGGCENMLLRTLPLLVDFEHKIITLKTLGELAPKFVSSGTAIETIHCDSIFNISGILRLRKIVKEENPDIIITYLFHADMIGRIALPATPKIPIIPFLRTTYNHPKYLIARILEWLTQNLVSQYLANSEAVKNFYIEHIGVRAEKITIIPNGIDTEYFNSMTPNPKLKESLGIRPDDIVIICVANLYINKGHRYLLEAFEKTYKRDTRVKLLLVGDGEFSCRGFKPRGEFHFANHFTAGTFERFEGWK